jgi:hypothetical protein
MSRSAWRVLGRIALLAVTPALTGANGLHGSFEARVLAAHNRERQVTGVPSLSWNPALAASARVWADHLAATGAFEHAPERPTDPEGENLWAGTRGYYSLEAMVDGWVREKRYTQLVWRETHQVGCAMARGAKEDVLVCRYAEAGNYLGERPF